MRRWSFFGVHKLRDIFKLIFVFPAVKQELIQEYKAEKNSFPFKMGRGPALLPRQGAKLKKTLI